MLAFANKKCLAPSTPDLHNRHIRLSLGIFSNLSVSKVKHVQSVLAVLFSTILTFPSMTGSHSRHLSLSHVSNH